MNTTMLARLTLLALVAPPLAAQDEAAVLRQEAAAWVLEQAGEDTFLSPAELARALAEVQVLIDVDRDEQTAEMRLAELVNRGWAGLEDAPEDKKRRDVLQLSLESFAIYLSERGYLQAALHMLGEDTEQPTGNAPLDAAMRSIFDAPLVATMREGLREQLAADDGPDDLDPVQSAVQHALENNDQGFIDTLGPAALPALSRLILEMPDRIVLRGTDPLTSLAWLDPGRALVVIDEVGERGGPVWRSRVLAALRRTSLLDEAGSEGPAHPAAYELLARYIQRPDTAKQAWPLTSVVDQHKLPAALWDILRESVRADDSDLRSWGLELLNNARGDGEVGALALELLASPHADARMVSARILIGYYEDRSVLPAMAQDSDDAIRELAAEQLATSRDAAEQRVLEALLTDPSEQVRLIAFQSVRKPSMEVSLARGTVNLSVWAQPPADEVMQALAADPSQQVRMALVGRLRELPERAVLPFLETYLSGPHAREALANASDVVFRLLYLRHEDTDRYFATVRRIVELAPELTRSGVGRMWIDAASWWKDDPAEMRALVDLACTTENPQLLEYLLEAPNERGMRLPGGRFDERLAGLEAERWARLARAVDRSELPKDEVARLVAEMPAGARTTVVSLAGDETNSPELRFASAMRLVSMGEPGMEELVLAGIRGDFLTASIRQPEDNAIYPGRSLARSVRGLWWEVDGPRRNNLITRLMGDSLVPDETAAYFASGFAAKDEQGPEIARAILARWGAATEVSDPAGDVVRAVITQMDDAPEIRDDEWLGRALVTSSLESHALSVVERLRDPVHLPFLVDYLGRSRFVQGRQQALRILASYRNEAAVEALVDAAASAPWEEEAEYCLKMIERVRQLHLAHELWRDLASEKHSREGSVTELLALLDDPSEAVRVQAVRGLATFGAIEAIPALIRHMQEASPTLRTEIETALEKLNRSEGE